MGRFFHKEHEGSIRLGAGHSLITGHGPRLAFLEKEAAQRKNDLEKLGLFEYATPNFNTYYPEASAADLAPKEEEFIRPVYRALSEVIVRKNIDPLDFSMDGVLKASMGMLLAQTVYTNHDAFIGNEVGVVSKTFWGEGYTENGKKIPAGINAEFLIDGKAHPNLARKILMDPPAVHSNSVTVTFKWTPSHPKMAADEFRAKSGSYDDKGQLIRRIVSEVTAYYETSLVSHGADPFAQQIRDGKIVNPTFASNRDSFSEKKEGSKQYFMFSYKDSLSEITIPANLTKEESGDENDKSTIKMKKDTIILLAALMGFAISAETLALEEEAFQEAFDLEGFEGLVATKQPELLALQTQVTTLTTEKDRFSSEKDTAEAEVQRLTAENQSLKASEPEIAQMKADLLADVQRLYALAAGKPATDALTATFQKADYAGLKSFQEAYSTQLEGKFESRCQDCNSTNISRNSARVDDEGNEGGKGETKKESFREMRERIQNGSLKLEKTNY